MTYNASGNGATTSYINNNLDLIVDELLKCCFDDCIELLHTSFCIPFISTSELRRKKLILLGVVSTTAAILLHEKSKSIFNNNMMRAVSEMRFNTRYSKF